jgi:hypothetical protein
MAFEGHFGEAVPPYSRADKAVMGRNSKVWYLIPKKEREIYSVDFRVAYRCYVSQIWAHEISFFVLCAHDITHPSSDSAQSLLRVCSGWLTAAHLITRLRRSILNCFNSSRARQELAPYLKISSLGFPFTFSNYLPDR